MFVKVLLCFTALTSGIATAACDDNLQYDEIENVHVIYMNHLDVGYDGIPEVGFVNNVINRYFRIYFPRAIQLARELTAGGYTETFIYTTHTWLVSLYVDCPPNLILAGVKLQCPNDTELADFTQAVKAGYITWHAGPMNLQTDNIDRWLFDFGLKLGSDLDERFGIFRKVRVLSQRDVPGMTQAVLPSLVQANIVGVSVGVNGGTPPPAVPPLFVWQYANYEVLASWHKGGYPDNPGPDPAHAGGLSHKDCVVTWDSKAALCFAFRTDNSGPPESVQEILQYYEILRTQFPNADIKASTLEAFFEVAQQHKESLPVISKEITDTWTQGIGTDPRKSAEYRAVQRVLGQCLQAGECSLHDKRVYNASRFLLKLAEHTWGLAGVYDNVNWSNTAFTKARTGGNFVNCTLSWLEQRHFVNLTIEALGDHLVVDKIRHELALLQFKPANLTNYTKVSNPTAVKFNCAPNNVTLSFSDTGALNHFIYQNVDFASQLGTVVYETFSEQDFDDLAKVYSYGGWEPGFHKTNVTKNADPQHKLWQFMLAELYAANDGACDFYVHVSLPANDAHNDYGAPSEVWVHYTMPVGTSFRDVGVDIELLMYDKTATRLPEALYYTFQPAFAADVSVLKLGSPIDPYNVVLNASQYQHGVDDSGVTFVDHTGKWRLAVHSPDVPLACLVVGTQPPTVFPAPLQPLRDTIRGVAYNIFNNVWDTNFIFWYPYIDEDKDFKSRFQLRVSTYCMDHSTTGC